MRGGKRTLIGRVVSNKMSKTVVVEVETSKRHPLYRRTMRMRKRYKAHDENSACSEGDLVSIMEHRPISKDKRWLVQEVIGHREATDVGEEDVDITPVREAVIITAEREEPETMAEEDIEEEEDAEEDEDDEDEEEEDEDDKDDDDIEEDDDEEEDADSTPSTPSTPSSPSSPSTPSTPSERDKAR